MLAKLALLQQLQKALHEYRRRCSDGFIAAKRRVEIKEIDDHPLDRIEQHIAVEKVVAFGSTLHDIQHRLMKLSGLFVGEGHNGILKQQHPATHPVVGKRCGQFDELRRDKDVDDFKVLGGAKEFAQFTFSQDETVSLCEMESLIVEPHLRLSVETQRVRQIPLHLLLLRGGECMTDDYLFHIRAARVAAKIQKNIDICKRFEAKCAKKTVVIICVLQKKAVILQKISKTRQN